MKTLVCMRVIVPTLSSILMFIAFYIMIHVFYHYGINIEKTMEKRQKRQEEQQKKDEETVLKKALCGEHPVLTEGVQEIIERNEQTMLLNGSAGGLNRSAISGMHKSNRSTVNSQINRDTTTGEWLARTTQVVVPNRLNSMAGINYEPEDESNQTFIEDEDSSSDSLDLMQLGLSVTEIEDLTEEEKRQHKNAIKEYAKQTRRRTEMGLPEVENEEWKLRLSARGFETKRKVSIT
jgi:hypothetical protein